MFLEVTSQTLMAEGALIVKATTRCIFALNRWVNEQHYFEIIK